MVVTVTETAAREVASIAKQQELNPESIHLRVGVKGGGCSGLTYVLDYTTEITEADRIFERDGVRIVCDPKSMMFLAGTTLDFSGGLNGKGFTFVNPNATGTCGCGESFKV